MANYKLIGAKENETPEETVIRCANNLVKAVLAAGYSLHSTPGVSGLDVCVHSNSANEVKVQNILSHWEIRGKCPVKISFKPANEELVLDEEV